MGCVSAPPPGDLPRRSGPAGRAPRTLQPASPLKPRPLPSGSRGAYRTDRGAACQDNAWRDDSGPRLGGKPDIAGTREPARRVGAPPLDVVWDVLTMRVSCRRYTIVSGGEG